MDRLLTTEDLAALLGISPRTIEGWRLRQTGPHFLRLSRKCIRYRLEDVQTWMAKNQHRSTLEYETRQSLAA